VVLGPQLTTNLLEFGGDELDEVISVKHVNQDGEISKIVRACKLELYELFVKNFRYWWKEEDLQSYLYHLLLTKLPSAIEPLETLKRVHREYPLIVSEKSRIWSGVVDIAILEPFKNEFKFFDSSCAIRDAIELKFLRDYRTGFSSGSDAEFKKAFERDHKKLMREDIINFSGNSQKHLLFFRKIRKIDKSKIPIPFDSVKKMLENGKEINIEGVQFSYIEVYKDGIPSPLLNNWDEKIVALPISRGDAGA
jgi:hypothetical protein